jgi:ATP-dependent DNA helicase RecG
VGAARRHDLTAIPFPSVHPAFAAVSETTVTAAELLEQLNALDEHERIEAKRGSEVGRSVLETVCAFANEPGLKGGTLLLGVEPDEQAPFPAWGVTGVSHPDKIAADLASRCANDFNVPVRVDIRHEAVDGKVVLVVQVPEAGAGDKPVYFKSRGLPRGALRRIGSTDQECTEEDLLVLYQGRQGESFDATLMADAGMDDLDSEAVADYRRDLAAYNPTAEVLRWPDEELLQALGAVRRDDTRMDAPMRPTVAGVMLFGKPIALRRLLPAMRIEYIRVPGRDWVGDPEHRFDSVDIRDPLPRAVRRALAAVMDDLPKSFHLPEQALQRRDVPLLPLNVVREAIVNAVMHRSYRVHGAVQLIRYANRLEVRNPGYSLKPIEHLGEPGSQLRNPRIAAVLYDMRLAETKGTGVGAMRRLMLEAGLEPPLFSTDRGADQFVATYYFQHFLNEDSIAWLARFKSMKLRDEEAKALVAVREQGAIDNAMYRELNRVDALAASQTLRRLRDAGLLEQKGRGSATYYVPTPYLLEPPGRLGDKASEEGLSPMVEALSPKAEALSPKLPTRDHLLDALPPALRERVLALGRRSPPKEVEEVLVALCKWRPQGTDSLAALLGRRRDTVGDYVGRLLRQGRLQATHPESPRHPHQTYQASGGEP